MMGGFVGMILALQTGVQLKKYAAEDALGPLVGLALIKEFGPVITAFVLAGRVGSAFAAEIGSMVVYEEVDSLKTMGVNPVAYLAMPRFVACMLVVPTLVIYCDIIGLLGGCLVGKTFVGVRPGLFFEKFYLATDFSDIFRSLVKSTIFGAIIAVIGCREGFNTSGGPEGVGRATTQSVVESLVLILVFDYFVERLMI
jgi:phospholipid/cholesterol/gamma-HCH transport system permease protein